MDSWLVIIITLCISFCLIFLFNIFFSNSKSKKKLPPGPFTFPIIGSLPLLRNKTLADIELMLQKLKSKYGPIITLRIGTSFSIFISSHSLAYQALIQQGALCSDRPIALPTNHVLSSHDRTINTASCGPTWRLLRRNLRLEMLHPSLVKSQSKTRAWALSVLIHRLLEKSNCAAEVMVLDHIKHAIYSLLVFMSFGDKLDEAQIKQITDLQHRALLATIQFKILNIFPRIGKIIFRNRWKELTALRKEVDSMLIPLIQARVKYIEEKAKDGVHKKEEQKVAYVDTLLNLELPEEKRKLTYEEMVSLCGEFLGAASDTMSTSLQWIMAYLVKYPSIQEKLYKEICKIVGALESTGENNNKLIKEENLQKMSYLKAVILEGLRRHPPSHFLLPHRVGEEMELSGYVIPKNSIIYFMVREMGLDPKVWEDPMKFKPERFLNTDRNGEPLDITRSREIKMMPFGVGRRICPGYDFALLHLEYFVANLIWHFEWKPVEGHDVDLTEELDFTFTMKNPLRACISPRLN
ncbi:cytochrome P450 89A2-like [Nicotiana sylvestris]|uniref:Cytochrome P450 89A2-like n=1 Tax=Nicotiana sylvestris TaxID=4096 RepID=A0A1U7YYN9_NICSY|nr:PREDICTED: cytochrome P450 89A2-like [Nicotiana sylvestris]